ncbi:MAG: hypothetical protein COV67_06370 [Nitrospinae bacterium CG11_big_fil_rev_8_21_14_0_20_56_8]|nr:MAG: hypothetical protein COV67_06370 [Nitrospinae bacterium CG11_big_fil_rev_8_21_14_0_20_56_8]
MPTPAQVLLTHLDWSIQHMQDSLNRPRTDYYRNAALQRFRFTFDLAVKTIAALGGETGETCPSPAECFSLAERRGWSEDCKDLLSSFEKLTTLPLTQNAEEIYARLTVYHQFFRRLHANLDRAIRSLPSQSNSV